LPEAVTPNLSYAPFIVAWSALPRSGTLLDRFWPRAVVMAEAAMAAVVMAEAATEGVGTEQATVQVMLHRLMTPQPQPPEAWRTMRLRTMRVAEPSYLRRPACVPDSQGATIESLKTDLDRRSCSQIFSRHSKTEAGRL
jgi:hypothetical protein